jgi:uncharacterized membrane protein YfcA
MDQYVRLLWLVPLGFLAGAYGTLIGAGGGFVLAPVLLLIYPDEAPETIASISLAVVFFNALSGTIAYTRANRINYQAGMRFAAATVPGAVAGALANTALSRAKFDVIFGVLLIVVAGFLALNPGKQATGSFADATLDSSKIGGLSAPALLLGALLSALFGFISSFFGIGGGFLYVPALMHLLHYPVHNATATSVFILTITAFTGSATHVALGLFHHGIRRAILLAIGAIFGAQIGASLSHRLHGDWIIRGLALALTLVGLRLLFNIVV